MTHLSIKSRLWLLVIGLLSVLTIVSGVLFQRLYVANQGISSVYENQVLPLKQMSEVASGYNNGVLISLDRAIANAISPSEAARLIAEKPRRKGKWAEWVRNELDTMTPPEYASMVRSEVNKLMAAASAAR